MASSMSHGTADVTADPPGVGPVFDHATWPELQKAMPYSGMDFGDGFPAEPQKLDGALWSSSSAFPPLPGDFYCEPEDVVRSVCLESPSFDIRDQPSLKGGIMGSSAFPDLMGGEFYPDLNCDLPFGLKPLDDAFLASSSSTTFERSDTPPSAPTDPFFRYELTTLHMSRCNADSIANSLLELLRTRMIASILKMNRTKFTIKAEVVIGDTMCILKIRIYQDGSKLAVEFQRRSGDCLAFQAAYQQAATHLGCSDVIAPNATSLEVSAKLITAVLDDAEDFMGSFEVGSLLQMAANAQDPELQAQAAGAIAQIASQLHCLEDLWSTFGALKTLLKSDRTDINHSVACTLATFAQNAEVAPHMHDPELISLIHEKINSADTGLLTRQKFTRALQQ